MCIGSSPRPPWNSRCSRTQFVGRTRGLRPLNRSRVLGNARPLEELNWKYADLIDTCSVAFPKVRQEVGRRRFPPSATLSMSNDLFDLWHIVCLRRMGQNNWELTPSLTFSRVGAVICAFSAKWRAGVLIAFVTCGSAQIIPRFRKNWAHLRWWMGLRSKFDRATE